MPVPTPANFYELHLHFQYSKYGWQEKHWIVATGTPPIAQVYQPFILARLLLLPVTATFVYGRYSNVGKPRDRHHIYPVDLNGNPLPFGSPGMSNLLTLPPTTPDPADVDTCFLLQLETASGAWGTKFMRCIPASEVAKNAAVHPIVDPTSSFAPPVTAGGMIASWPAAVTNYMAGLKGLTMYATKSPNSINPPPTGQYDTEAWTGCNYRGVSSKDTGRPFGTPVGRVILR